MKLLTRKPYLSNVGCPVCGAAKNKVVYTSPRSWGQFRRRFCHSCRTSFVTHQLIGQTEIVATGPAPLPVPSIESDEPDEDIEPTEPNEELPRRPMSSRRKMRLVFLEIKHGIKRCRGEIDREELAVLYEAGNADFASGST